MKMLWRIALYLGFEMNSELWEAVNYWLRYFIFSLAISLEQFLAESKLELVLSIATLALGGFCDATSG